MSLFSTIYLNILIKAKIKRLLNVLPFFKRDDYTKFLIIGHPRTGTSLLHTYLNSHWNVLSLNEPLTHTTDSSFLFKKQSKLIKAVGFKYFYEYMNDEMKKNILIELLKSNTIKIIKINRKNYLRTYVSRCIAEKTNEWSSTSGKQYSVENKKVNVTKEACLHAFDAYRKDELKTQAVLTQYGAAIFEIEYNVLVAEPAKTMFAIQEFLGLSQQMPESLLVRQNAEPLHMLIENYNDLKKSFLGTAFEIFFEE